MLAEKIFIKAVTHEVDTTISSHTAFLHFKLIN